MAQILVAGLGFVGLNLVNELDSLGHQVTGLCRTPRETGIAQINKDILELTSQDLPEKIDYVFYLLSADGRNEQAYEKVYHLGVEHLLSCLVDKQVKRFILVSSTGVYPQDKGEWIDEGTRFTPSGFAAKALMAGERLVDNSTILSTVVRFSGLYGPGRDSLIRSVKQGQAKRMSRQIYTNRIHRDDAVGCLLHLMTLPNAESLYLGTDSEPALYNDILEWLAQVYEVKLSEEMQDSKRTSKRLSNKKLKQSGYLFKYPTYREGYQFPLV